MRSPGNNTGILILIERRKRSFCLFTDHLLDVSFVSVSSSKCRLAKFFLWILTEIACQETWDLQGRIACSAVCAQSTCVLCNWLSQIIADPVPSSSLYSSTDIKSEQVFVCSVFINLVRTSFQFGLNSFCKSDTNTNTTIIHFVNVE